MEQPENELNNQELENDETNKLVEVETRRLGGNGWLIGKAEYYYDFSF